MKIFIVQSKIPKKAGVCCGTNAFSSQHEKIFPDESVISSPEEPSSKGAVSLEEKARKRQLQQTLISALSENFKNPISLPQATKALRRHIAVILEDTFRQGPHAEQLPLRFTKLPDCFFLPASSTTEEETEGKNGPVEGRSGSPEEEDEHLLLASSGGKTQEIEHFEDSSKDTSVTEGGASEGEVVVSFQEDETAILNTAAGPSPCGPPPAPDADNDEVEDADNNIKVENAYSSEHDAAAVSYYSYTQSRNVLGMKEEDEQKSNAATQRIQFIEHLLQKQFLKSLVALLSADGAYATMWYPYNNPENTVDAWAGTWPAHLWDTRQWRLLLSIVREFLLLGAELFQQRVKQVVKDAHKTEAGARLLEEACVFENDWECSNVKSDLNADVRTILEAKLSASFAPKVSTYHFS